MTATSSTSTSSKAKAKFSSRNLSAVYKAPALRGDELGGGGVSVGGLNRMLVLKAPVRGGAKAITVAAPTPINTPSLRKENLGQDIHVNLVPAGKSGGWGVAGENGDVRTQQPAQHSASHDVQANEWRAAEKSSSRTTSSSSLDGAAVESARTRASSGRWGDDAVEEDLALSEQQRHVQHTRDYPELPNPHHHEHVEIPVQRHVGFSQDARTMYPSDRYHHEPYQYDRHDHAPGPHFGRSPEYERGRYNQFSAVGNGHSETTHQHRLQSRHVDERGFMNQYRGNQDARYDSPSRYALREPPYCRPTGSEYRSHPYDHGDHRDHLQHHDTRGREGHSPVGYNDGPRHCRDHPSYSAHETLSVGRHGELEKPDRNSTHQSKQDASSCDNQVEDQERTRNCGTPWRAPLQPQVNGTAVSSVWKMSEAEVSTVNRVPDRTMHHFARPFSRHSPEIVSSSPPTHTGTSVSRVRILKRTGPRMLFDPKSGTMVEVDDVSSARRPNTSSPATVDLVECKGESPVKITSASKTSRKDSSMPVQDEALPAPAADERSALQQEEMASQPTNSSDVMKSTTPSSPATDRKQRPRTKPNEQKSSKRLAIGGKMKKVVVAYRPVVTEKEVQAVETSVERATESVTREDRGQPEQAVVAKTTRRKARDPVEKKREKVLTTKTKSVKLEHTTKRVKSKPAGENASSVGQEKKQPRDAQTSLVKKNRVVELTEAQPTTRASTKASAGVRFDELKTFSAGDGVVFVDEEHSARVGDADENDAATFTTVKSRRAILQERKREREQLVAALSGFHERGGVKRVSNRVVLPASLARYGKKGLLVGFRPTAATMGVGASPLPLVKPFIDVIRPPASKTDPVSKPNDLAVDEPTKLTTTPAKKRVGKAPKVPQTSPSCSSASQTQATRRSATATNEASVVAAPKRHEKRPSEHLPQTRTGSSVALNSIQAIRAGQEEEKQVQSVPQSTKHMTPSGNRERRPSVSKKGPKKMYVPKQVQPVEPASVSSRGLVASKLPQALCPSQLPSPVKPEAPVAECVAVDGTEPARAAEKENTAVPKLSTKTVKSRSQRPAPRTRKSAPPEVDSSIKQASPLPEHRKERIKPKPVAKQAGDSTKRQVTTATKKRSEMANVSSQMEKKHLAVVSKVAPEVVASRPAGRPSNAKTLEAAKSVNSSSTSGSSTRKIYKKVYVVKAPCAATSLSAA